MSAVSSSKTEKLNGSFQIFQRNKSTKIMEYVYIQKNDINERKCRKELSLLVLHLMIMFYSE